MTWNHTLNYIFWCACAPVDRWCRCRQISFECDPPVGGWVISRGEGGAASSFLMTAIRQMRKMIVKMMTCCSWRENNRKVPPPDTTWTVLLKRTERSRKWATVRVLVVVAVVWACLFARMDGWMDGWRIYSGEWWMCSANAFTVLGWYCVICRCGWRICGIHSQQEPGSRMGTPCWSSVEKDRI